MHISALSSLGIAVTLASTAIFSTGRTAPTVVHVIDTVFVRTAPPGIDYDELARRVAVRMKSAANPTVIDGDLIVKGRLAVGGAPEPGTEYGVTIRGPVTSSLRFISNEALKDPQRTARQSRHVGTLSL